MDTKLNIINNLVQPKFNKGQTVYYISGVREDYSPQFLSCMIQKAVPVDVQGERKGFIYKVINEKGERLELTEDHIFNTKQEYMEGKLRLIRSKIDYLKVQIEMYEKAYKIYEEQLKQC